MLAHSGLNAAAAHGVQLRSSEEGLFSLFEISNERPVLACSAHPLPFDMRGIRITAVYEGDRKGTYSVPASALPPSRPLVLEGDFRSDSYVESQYMFLHMDAQFAGSAPVRLDPGKMFVEVEVETAIIGVVPYSTTTTHLASDFYDIMNGAHWKDGCD